MSAGFSNLAVPNSLLDTDLYKVLFVLLIVLFPF